MANKLSNKSEILFLYETSYNIPNGDPFTGEQRYDEETKKILVSDVRIKRYIRTYLEDNNQRIYVSGKQEIGTAAKSLTSIAKEQEKTDVAEILKELIDVKLFGGISTLSGKEKDEVKNKHNMSCHNEHVQFTGPVQFALLNPSLNRTTLRIHQNTSHFTSKDGNSQGAIGTTSVVPYSILQIHGWINPKVAETTGMTEEDKFLMLQGMWYGTSGEGSSFSRSKVGQQSVLLLELVYKADTKKQVYGVDRLITIKPKDGKKDEQLRSMDDFDFDFTKLQEVLLKENTPIDHIKYYTEINGLAEKLWSQIIDKKENDQSIEVQVVNEELKGKFHIIEEL